jgi:large subunit ribosomal protein L25
MARLELDVSVREGTGKGVARKLRAKGAIPAVVYGSGAETIALSVDESMLQAVVRQGSNQIIDLKGPSGFDGRLVLVKELQRHPVSRRLLHCDFYTVDTSQTIEVSIGVHVEGRPHGVEMGGILEVVLREIEVRCLPLAIPERLDVDVSALDIGDALHVFDLALPEGVELISDPSQTLLHVVAPRVEEEPAEEEGEAVEGETPAEGEAPAEGDAPKVEEGSGD